MEYTRVGQDFKYLAQNGISLNVEERMNIDLALQQLSQEMKFEELLFWGKVEGKLFAGLQFQYRMPN